MAPGRGKPCRGPLPFMKVSTTVVVNLHGVRKFKEAFENDLRLSENGPIREAMHEWAVLIARFLTKRWEKFSKGGGDWEPLKPATIKRKKKRGWLLYILRATDQMFESFAPEIARKPGRVTQDVPFGIRIGFGGGMKYPHKYAKGLTIAQLAMIHQTGEGRVPARKIIVPPDMETRAKMREVMQEAINRMEK